MAKVMLVEDDNNLREIYEARLLAEGYEIISAQDGEEALALAVKQRPDLIIADIMMPKISGFDMLDILRSTPETKDTKIIMMTALSQAEDKDRANKLGADRYLVKSQVTLEDVARVAHEVLEGKTADTPASVPPQADTPSALAALSPTPEEPAAQPSAAQDNSPPLQDSGVIGIQSNQPEPVQATAIPAPVVTSIPVAAPTEPSSDQPAVAPTATSPISNETNNDGVLAAAVASVNGDTPPAGDNLSTTSRHSVAVASTGEGSSMADHGGEAQAKTVLHTKTISPINDLRSQGADLQTLLAKEEAKEAAVQGVPVDQAVVAEVNAVPDDTTPPAISTISPTQPSGTDVAGTDPNAIAL